MKKHWDHNPLIGNYWLQSPETQSESLVRDCGVWRSSGPGRMSGRGWTPDRMSGSWQAHSRSLTNTRESGAQLAGPQRAEVSAVEQVVGI